MERYFSAMYYWAKMSRIESSVARRCSMDRSTDRMRSCFQVTVWDLVVLGRQIGMEYLLHLWVVAPHCSLVAAAMLHCYHCSIERQMLEPIASCCQLMRHSAGLPEQIGKR
jgi:hypothetical protein